MKVKNSSKLLIAVTVIVLAALACQSPISMNDVLNLPAIANTQENSVIVEDVAPVEAVDQPTSYTAVDLVAQSDALVRLYDQANEGVVAIISYAGEIQGFDVALGSGSGFVYDDQGHIVTNYHVVEGATKLEVSFPSGIKTSAEVVGTDTDSDLAVLKVDLPAEELNPLTLGDSDLLRVGQLVVAIGNPFGLNGTMTTGIVSSLGRSLDSLNASSSGQPFAAGDLIQTDAAINPGNSGGPLLNLDGEVVGLNRAIRTYNTNENSDPVNSGIGFAVSVNIIKRVVPSLIADGSYAYPYLGISSYSDIPMSEAERVGLDKALGAMVTAVVPDGPADQAGIQVDDVILAIDGHEVLTFSDMIGYLFTTASPGDVVEMGVWRNGEKLTIDFTLGSRPVNDTATSTETP